MLIGKGRYDFSDRELVSVYLVLLKVFLRFQVVQGGGGFTSFDDVNLVYLSRFCNRISTICL